MVRVILVVVAVLGVTAYRVAFGVPKARMGEQPERLHTARLWVVPNPSGLNAHDTVETLAAAYAEPARAAGLLPRRSLDHENAPLVVTITLPHS